MHAVIKALGEHNVLSRTCITPQRTDTTTSEGLELRSAVNFDWLFAHA
jgi:hypothetical protein